MTASSKQKAVSSNSCLVCLLLTVCLLTGRPVEAQQTGKIFRIGILDPSTAAGSAVLWEAFRQELSKLGWIEGKNITIEYRFAEQKGERLPELATELVRLKVDLIVVPDRPSTLAVKKASTTIPVVMTNPADPVELGLVDSLARPGGNVTGLTSLSRELAGKRLELFKEAAPKLARVAVLYEAANQASAIEVKEILPVAARALGMTIQAWEIQAAGGFDGAFAAISKWRPDGLYVSGGASIIINQKRTVGFALNNRLPSIYSNTEAVDDGLMYYGADRADSYRRVAYYVDRILKGAKPADMPVEQPTKFELVFNLKTAKQIGVTIPPNVLVRADKVIK